jgi:hypothetical protein
MRCEWKNVHKNLIGKPQERGPLGRPRHKWKENTEMNLTETRWKDVNWIHLLRLGSPRQRSVTGSCEHGKEPLCCSKI